MSLKLQRTQTVSNALDCVLNRVRKVVHRVNAPLVARSVVVQAVNSVDNRVTHIKVARCKVNLRTQGHLAVLKFTVFHTLKQVKAFFNRAVSVRTLCRRLRIASVLSDLLGSKLANVGKSLFNQLNCVLVHLLKILGRIVKSVVPVKAKPLDVLLDSVNILNVLFCWVGIVHTEVADSAELFSRAKVNADSLCVADMQIAVRLGRKASMNLFTLKSAVFGNILIYKIVNEVVLHNLFIFNIFNFFSHKNCPSCLYNLQLIINNYGSLRSEFLFLQRYLFYGLLNNIRRGRLPRRPQSHKLLCNLCDGHGTPCPYEKISTL